MVEIEPESDLPAERCDVLYERRSCSVEARQPETAVDRLDGVERRGGELRKRNLDQVSGRD